MRAVIPLTDAQRAALLPLFNLIAKYNADGVLCAIGAQCFPDGIGVKVFHGNKRDMKSFRHLLDGTVIRGG